jgi:YbbR domain-containing protein
MVAVGLFVFQQVKTMDSKGFDSPLVIVANSELVPVKRLPGLVRITVETTKDELDNISENTITASIDLSNYKIPGEYNVPVEITPRMHVLNVDSIEINVRPRDIPVSLDKKDGKYVPVSPYYNGSVAPGYELTSQNIVPKQVWIEGPASIVENIKFIPTETIDITGRTTDISRVVSIDKNRIDEMVQVNVVNFQFNAVVRSIEQEREWDDLHISFINLNDAFSIKSPVTGETESATAVKAVIKVILKLRGNEQDIHAYEPAPETVSADCSQITGEGEWTVNVTATVPAQFQIIDYEPKTITIDVENAN